MVCPVWLSFAVNCEVLYIGFWADGCKDTSLLLRSRKQLQTYPLPFPFQVALPRAHPPQGHLSLPKRWGPVFYPNPGSECSLILFYNELSSSPKTRDTFQLLIPLSRTFICSTPFHPRPATLLSSEAVLIIHLPCTQQLSLSRINQLSYSFKERGLREVGTEKAYNWEPPLISFWSLGSHGKPRTL